MSNRPVPRDPQFATTLWHGIAILEAFQIGSAALTNKEIAARTGLSKATVSRLTSTLQSRDLLLFDGQAGRYRLASSALTIGYALLASLTVRRDARHDMKVLADELGGSVSLGMRDRSRMVYVETSRSGDPSTFQPDIGAALPMLQTAMGRVWLAAAPKSLCDGVLATIRHETPEHHARWIDRLDTARRAYHRDGFCCAFGDWQADMYAAALPLDVDVDGERLVLDCGVPGHRFRRSEMRGVVGPKLIVLARTIEAAMRASAGSEPRPRAATPADVSHDRPSPRRVDPPHAHTLARGLDLLLSIVPGEGPVSHGTLARRLALDGPTVSRLTHTLVLLGYLRRDARTGLYRPGAATLTFAHPLLAQMRVRQVARPLMAALSKQVRGAVSLGFRHQASMVYADTAWQGDDRVTPPDTGAPMPMLYTSMGKAWLCAAPAAERRAVLNRLRVLDPAAYARHAGGLDAALDEFHARGICSSRGEFRRDVIAFAVPFAQPVEGTRFVMNCGLLATRMPFVQARALVAGPLRDTVRLVERMLRGAPDD